MNIEQFISKRILVSDNDGNKFTKPIVRISVLGISLGLAVMILTICVITGFQKEIENKLFGFMNHIQVVNYDANYSDEPIPISKNQDFLKELKSIPEIKHIEVYATKSGILKTDEENEGIILKGISKDYDWSFVRSNLKSGKVFTVTDSLSKSIVISKYFADKLKLKLNDKVVVYFLTKKSDSVSEQYIQRAKAFYINGIYETGLEDIDKHMALVDLRHIQSLNYWNNDQITGFEISLYDYHKIDETAEQLNDLIDLTLIAQTVKQTNPAIFSWLELQDINALIIILLMVVVAGVNMISALLVLIFDRTNMIGLLKALGAKNYSIQKIFMYNAAYLIGRGLLWGNVLGISIALIQQQFGIIQLDQSAYYVSVIPININLWHILLLNVGTLLCCLLMLVLPTFVILKISPIKAIQHS